MARSIRGPAGNGSGGVFRMVERTGLRKGVEGNKNWFYVGTALWTLRTVRRMAGDKEQILISEQLKPGQRITIANGRATIDDGPETVIAPPKGRRGRKQAKQAAKAAAKRDAKEAKKAAKRGAKAQKKASKRGTAPAPD